MFFQFLKVDHDKHHIPLKALDLTQGFFHIQVSPTAFSSWQEDDETLTAVYKMIEGRDPALGVRVFSKLKIVMALKKADLWILTRTWIEENGLYDLYLAAQDFREDNEFFIQGKSELQRLTGKSAEEIEAILAMCIAD